jgi:hypothetical protein
MSSVRGQLFAGFLCLGFGEATTDAELWRAAIRDRHPSLFACVVPEALATRVTAALPPETSETVACTADPIVNDGCSVTVVAVPSSHVVAVVLAGGFSGALHRVLGPFNRDASDF